VWSRRSAWLVNTQKIQKKYVKKAVKYGYVLIPAAVAGWGVNFSSRLVVEKYQSMQAVGLFSFAGNIAMILSFVMVSLSQAWVPSYYAARKKGSEDQIKDAKHQIEKIVILVGGGALICLSTVGVSLISLIVSSKYVEAIHMVLPLAAGYVFYGLINVETRGFMFSEKNMRVSAMYMLAALLTIVFAVVLVPHYGAYGASIASLSALGIVMFVTLYLAHTSAAACG